MNAGGVRRGMYCRKWLDLHTLPIHVVLVPLEKQYQAKKDCWSESVGYPYTPVFSEMEVGRKRSMCLCILLEHGINVCFPKTLKIT